MTLQTDYSRSNWQPREVGGVTGQGDGDGSADAHLTGIVLARRVTVRPSRRGGVTFDGYKL